MNKVSNVNLEQLGGPQLAEIGKIKIGGKGKKVKSKGGREFRLPEKFDHFIITTNFRDPATDDLIPDTRLMEEIGKQTGQDPKCLRFLPVSLIFDNPDLNMYTRFSCYRGNVAWCVGNGITAARLVNKTGERREIECPCNRVLPGYPGQDKCKIFGRLSVLLRGVERIGGVWVLRTTSWNSVRNILSSMVLIRQLTGGVLAGLPLILGVQPKTVVLPTTGQTQTIYVMSLEFRGTQDELGRKALEIKRERAEFKIRTELLEEEVRRRMLALPDDEEEGRDIQEEFYPENNIPEPDPSSSQEEGEQESHEAEAETEPSPEEGEQETSRDEGPVWEEGAQFAELEEKENAPLSDSEESLTLWD